MLDKRVTLKDVADRSGFHVSTVSRVLRGDAARISPETIAAVEQVAAGMGYQLNRWAASLRSGRTGIIGVLVPRITDIVLATVFEAIESEAAESGQQAVVSSTWDSLEARGARIDRYLGERVDGLIIADARLVDPPLRKLQADGFPIMLVSRGSRSLPSITGNDRAGGAAAATHLMERGRRNIAIIAGPKYATTAAHRSDGFRAAAAAAGQSINPEWVVESGFDVAGGRHAMRELLRRGSPDAVFAVNDFAAIGAMGVLKDNGLVVGKDVAVVGYNDIPIAAELTVGLTSVRVDLERMGRLAFQALTERINGGTPKSVRLEPELIPRASSHRG